MIMYILFVMELLNFCKKHIKKLLAVAGIVAVCYLLAATVFVVVALAADNRRGNPFDLSDLPPAIAHNPGESDYNGEFVVPGHFLTPSDPYENGGGILRPPARTNFILMGIDHFSLADAIMVGTLYRDTGAVHLMSVPRDTHIVLSQTRHNQLRNNGLWVPRELKLNELRSYGGRAQGPDLIMHEVSNMLGVEFHYYIEMHLSGFVRIIDHIGGVYFNVPRNMHFEDPAWNSVIAHVPAGYQRLNGRQAEGVIRYRGFANADLGRNTTQMQFMTALIEQLLTRDVLLDDPLGLASIIIDNVSVGAGNRPGTNASIPGLMRYLPVIPLMGEVNTFTMPGASGWRNNRSVFLPDVSELHNVANQVFRAHVEVEAGEADEDSEYDDEAEEANEGA